MKINKDDPAFQEFREAVVEILTEHQAELEKLKNKQDDDEKKKKKKGQASSMFDLPFFSLFGSKETE